MSMHTPEMPSNAPEAGWDCHIHVFDADAPVAAGHYQPQEFRLAQVEAAGRPHGIGHFVLVQPSVYGSDNGVMLAALRASAGRHRGVAVLDAPISTAELEDWHDAGVRAIRLNLVSPVGSARESVPALLRAMRPALRALGWHVQVYAGPADLPAILAWQRGHDLPIVLDHVAGMTPEHASDAAAWHQLRQLAEAGSWIKLSAWYRLNAAAPYGALREVVQRAHALFRGRAVWGSDWPHTCFAPDALPAYQSVLQPLGTLLPDARDVQAVLGAGRTLYR